MRRSKTMDLVFSVTLLISPSLLFRFTSLSRVVRKPVNANPGLKVNQRIYFSCIKLFFIAYDFCRLRLFKLKLKDKQCKQKTSPKSCKTEIKIRANPGLA